MHSDAFDRYHHGHSPLHDLDPRIKVIVTIAFILSNAVLPAADVLPVAVICWFGGGFG